MLGVGEIADYPSCSLSGGVFLVPVDSVGPARKRVRRVGDEHGDETLAEDVAQHANAPCASEIGEHDG